MVSKTRMLWELMRGQRSRYAAAIVAITAGVLISFLGPLIIRATIDSIIDSKPFDAPGWVVTGIEALGGRSVLGRNLWICAIGLVLIACACGLMMYLKGRWAAGASESITRKIRDLLYDHLQNLPCRFHDRHDTGDLVQRCTSDVETIHLFLSQQVVVVGQAAIMLLCVVPLMIYMSPPMAALSMCLIPAIIAYAVVFFAKVRFAFKASDEAEGRMTTTIQENLAGVRVVRAFARGGFERRKFASVNADFRDLDYRLVRILAWYWSVSDVMCFAQRGMVLLVGGWWAMGGRITVGDLVAFLALVDMFLWPIRSMGRTLTDLSKALVSLDRLQHILGEQREDFGTREGEAPAEPAPVEGEIVFENVSFAHGEAPILRDLSFRIEAGQTLAVLGPSGSGKSTVVNLLLRLYEYDSGSIRLDGRDIRTIDRRLLRSQIGTVMQEPFLYSKTLRENIRLGMAHAGDDEIISAAETAHLHASVEGFEQGYETIVGERGVTLSGGQRQRVALARAILKSPPILILDDALSAVDTRTEAMILRALRNRHGQRTTIVIAHRLSTLAWADFVIVLDEGRIVQTGTHETLMGRDGMYRRLWEIQNAPGADLDEEIQDASAS